MSHCAPSSSTGLTVFLVLPNRQPPPLSSNSTSNSGVTFGQIIFSWNSLGRVSGSRFSFLGVPPAIPVLARHDSLAPEAPGLIANHRRNNAIRTQHWKGETNQKNHANHAADDSETKDWKFPRVVALFLLLCTKVCFSCQVTVALQVSSFKFEV